MKVALVYDRVNKWGGAERVLLALHKLFPDAPLFTSVYDREKAAWAKVFYIKTSFLQKFPFATNHELYATLMPIAFETFSFDEYDLVISITSESGKGIVTKPKTKHICYCLTPTRYLWSGYEEYFKNPYFRFISKPAVSYLRFWDKIAAQRPDAYIAISKEVQGRIKKYYGRDSVVVYPPVTLEDGRGWMVDDSNLKVEDRESIYPLTSSFKNPSSTFYHPSSKRGYFLIVSRLVPYKKVDIALKAFDELGLPLRIIGVGSEMERLRRMAGSTVELVGNLTDRELVRYYRGCRCLVFPGLEDFGLTIIEAQSFGKPVIAFKGGGALETIIEGATGEFFYPQTERALVEKIKEFKNAKYDPLECMKNVERFSFERFKREFMDVIRNC
ncbi:MAG: glycosyltransferase [Patescibacteria group bacterium]